MFANPFNFTFGRLGSPAEPSGLGNRTGTHAASYCRLRTMQGCEILRSFQHDVYICVEDESTYISKVGTRFPERLAREAQILAGLAGASGIPRLLASHLHLQPPVLLIEFIPGKPIPQFDEATQLYLAGKVAAWLKHFAMSESDLPCRITHSRTAAERDRESLGKLQSWLCGSDELHTVLERIHTYQARAREHGAHRDFRVEHVLVGPDLGIWVVDWESAAPGYMLQDAGNFLASILKGRAPGISPDFTRTFLESICDTDDQRSELLDWSAYSLLSGARFQESLGARNRASAWTILARDLASGARQL